MILRGVTEDKLEKVVEAIFDSVKKSKNSLVIHLNGDLGAGKTTLTKYIAKHFGVNSRVQSPTFVFMREYELENKPFKKLYHIDAYRFDTHDEAKILNLEHLKEGENLIIIEWPEKLTSKDPDLELTLTHSGENTRDIKIKHAK